MHKTKKKTNQQLLDHFMQCGQGPRNTGVIQTILNMQEMKMSQRFYKIDFNKLKNSKSTWVLEGVMGD